MRYLGFVTLYIVLLQILSSILSLKTLLKHKHRETIGISYFLTDHSSDRQV